MRSVAKFLGDVAIPGFSSQLLIHRMGVGFEHLPVAAARLLASIGSSG